MSKFIDEIVKDIKLNPTSWRRFGSDGLKKENIEISDCFNGAILSVCDVKINKAYTVITYIDRYRIEKAYRQWMKTAPLSVISAT